MGSLNVNKEYFTIFYILHMYFHFGNYANSHEVNQNEKFFLSMCLVYKTVMKRVKVFSQRVNSPLTTNLFLCETRQIAKC